jgi:U32 family peptidase
MKIITGISNSHKADELEAYAKAGVDEFFIGYVPAEWSQEFGYEISCNRREHSNYQYHTRSEVENVVKLIHDNGKKVFLTLNAHEYSNDQFKLIYKIIKSIENIAIDGFIVSNVALMLELRRLGFEKPFNISIGAGSNSPEAIAFYLDNIQNINRIILPRKFTMDEVKLMTEYSKQKKIDIEVFALGDPCHFSDEYCFTWHGAANESLCNSSMYKHKTAIPIIFDHNWKSVLNTEPISSFFQKTYKVLESAEHQKAAYTSKHPTKQMGANEINNLNVLSRINKCGLCAIPKFKEWGVGSVKLPLRGHYIQSNLKVISLVKSVIEAANASPKFCQDLMNSPSFCSGDNCYYNYPYPN